MICRNLHAVSAVIYLVMPGRGVLHDEYKVEQSSLGGVLLPIVQAWLVKYTRSVCKGMPQAWK